MKHFSVKEEIGVDVPDEHPLAREVFPELCLKKNDRSFDFRVPVFSKRSLIVPDMDKNYVFDRDTTLGLLAGFAHNRRVIIQGYHGTGKSSHIEQVAARLNYPCLRINLDSHISRIDLMGKDAIVIKDGKQVTEFQEGILPWALQNPVALVFDEYDAGRPDVMFVLQRILEAEGKMTLLEKSVILTPHKHFRLFSTTNTVGLGDTTGLYHGIQPINQAQMDRWNIVCALNYLKQAQEVAIVQAHVPNLEKHHIQRMVTMANLTRQGLMNNDISTVMSPRTVLSWAENFMIFKDIAYSFIVSFLNRCDEMERPIVKEYFQRCFDKDLITQPCYASKDSIKTP